MTLQSQAPRAILFDLDDTILPGFQRPDAAWREVVEQVLGEKFVPNDTAFGDPAAAPAAEPDAAAGVLPALLPPVPPAGEFWTPGVAAPAPPAPPVPPVPPAVLLASRTVKLATVADQAWDLEATALAPSRVEELFAEYLASQGDEPPPDAEPSGDQIAAAEALLAADLPPAVDFALFRPNGKKFQRQLKFKAVLFNPDGQFRTVEQPGPGSYQAWRQSYALLRTTLLLLRAVTLARLDAYADHIRMLHERCGRSCWGLLLPGRREDACGGDGANP